MNPCHLLEANGYRFVKEHIVEDWSVSQSQE